MILAVISFISILVTIGILVTLLTETITFFTRVSITEFLFTTEWAPFSSSPKYGIWALVIGTLKLRLSQQYLQYLLDCAAIYLSEYASDRTRRIIKPILEILAGIPTIVLVSSH